MTNTTSLYASMPNRRTFVAPALAQPGILTFISQAVIGFTFGGFLLLAVAVLLRPTHNIYEGLFPLTLIGIVGIIIGTPVGLFMWVFTKLSNQVPSRTFRVTIAVLLLAIVCFSWMLLTYYSGPSSEDLGWLLLWVFVPGITIGLFSGSSLRPGRELVRGGEATLLLPRVLAGVTGLALRVGVVVLAKLAVIALISQIVLSYYNRPIPEPPDHQWIPVTFVHCTFAVFVLFARTRIELLAFLTVLMNVPFVASFWMYPDMPVEIRYWLMGYLVAWGLFLVSRWPQTDVAVDFLKQEFRYYLID